MAEVFTGKWICTPEFAEYRPRHMYRKWRQPFDWQDLGDAEPRNLHVLFEKRFVLKKTAGRYRIRVSADDYGKYSCNGIFFGQGPTPGYLEYYHYNEFDITDLLLDGENVLSAHVYYQGLINWVWISGDLRMGLIADLLAPDGSVLLSTDETWSCTMLPGYQAKWKMGYDTQFAEDFDARISLPAPVPAAVRKYDDVRFLDAPTRALEVYTVSPKTTKPLPGGGIFCDFGTELTGNLRITASGSAGGTVRMLCGEETDDSEYGVRHRMRCYCDYDETWTLADGENQQFEPYDYKAFRYAAVIPSDGVTVTAVEAVVRHAHFNDDACVPETDNKRLLDVFNLCKNGVKYGTQEVYVDCPSREKAQYAGDMTVTSGSQLWLTGDITMLEKGIREQARSAMICPGLMGIMTGTASSEIADYSLQFPLLLLRHWQFTHDKEFLMSMLPTAENMVRHFAQYARPDGLLDTVADKWNLVDWPEEMRDGYDFPLTIPTSKGTHNVINAFYVGCVRNIEEIKDILGIPHDDTGKRLADAFNRAFFRADTGHYVDTETSAHGAIHSNLLPAFYGFVPSGYEKQVGDYLVSRGMACGVYMSYFLLRGLARLGYYDYVYDRLVSEDEHSWSQMLRDGATTCMEAWGKDQKDNTSFCHPWASAPITVLIEDLLSVSYDGTVGTPHLPARAGKIRMKIPTAKGTVIVTAGKEDEL